MGNFYFVIVQILKPRRILMPPDSTVIMFIDVKSERKSESTATTKSLARLQDISIVIFTHAYSLF